ncbi:MAG: hypothetical protein PF692_15380 [Kiritimatiellae bacterium]|nr:hypothetical protein [Kiritimatiellia bacterium]
MTTIIGVENTISGFKDTAAIMFPCNRLWIARSDPHPGQWCPVT